MNRTTRKHLISLADLSDEALEALVSQGTAFAGNKASMNGILNGLIIGIYFRATSTRTRTSFSSAALRMGAHIISYGPHDLQENTGETIEDTARVLSAMLDGLVARTAGPTPQLRAFSAQNRMAVINAMSQEEHPTQAVADLTTMKQHFGEVRGLRVLYLGEGNNTAVALALSLPRFSNTELCLCTPPQYGVPAATMERAEQYAGRHRSKVVQHSNVKNLPKEVDVVYTTRWETTGTTKAHADWRDRFEPYAVSQELMDLYPNAIFMHDLPAKRGEEVGASVLDGPRSIAFKQAENKLYGAASVLNWCLGEGK